MFIYINTHFNNSILL